MKKRVRISAAFLMLISIVMCYSMSFEDAQSEDAQYCRMVHAWYNDKNAGWPPFKSIKC